jgi:hypothetical protein
MRRLAMDDLQAWSFAADTVHLYQPPPPPGELVCLLKRHTPSAYGLVYELPRGPLDRALRIPPQYELHSHVNYSKTYRVGPFLSVEQAERTYFGGQRHPDTLRRLTEVALGLRRSL